MKKGVTMNSYETEEKYKACKRSGHKVIYLEAYECDYCEICDSWLETLCSDPDCPFCIKIREARDKF